MQYVILECSRCKRRWVGLHSFVGPKCIESETGCDCNCGVYERVETDYLLVVDEEPV